MKLLAYSIFTLAIALCIATISPENIQQQEAQLPVGTVIYSMLPPEYFLAEHSEWKLLNGDTIPENSALKQALEQYDIHTHETLPDALGKFIRSINHNGKGSDPYQKETNQDRIVGAEQNDATSLPNESFTNEFEPAHHHNYTEISPDYGIDSDKIRVLGQGHKPMLGVIKQGQATSDSGRHTHIIGGGDQETRPVNIALYTYIKAYE